MKSKELKKKSDKDLQKLLSEKREELRSFRFGSQTGEARDVHKGRKIRKDIAHILTETKSRATVAK